MMRCFSKSAVRLFSRALSNNDRLLYNKLDYAHPLAKVLSRAQPRFYAAAVFGRGHEKLIGKPVKSEFKAETKKLLDIVAKSLYSDKEVFVRELVSNASDSLERCRYLQTTENFVVEGPLRINISLNRTDGTFEIYDNGIGMTKAELEENLGTIARSGSKAFIEKIKETGNEIDPTKVIGQFGVGFYSTFMVADKIEVYSRSRLAPNEAYKWSCDGSTEFEIQEAEGIDFGTRIVLHLKRDCTDFAKDDMVQSVIKKYSNFVGFPIMLDDAQINSQKALWLDDPKSVESDEHEEFYRFISGSYDKPRYIIHYRTDAPLNVRALLYVPQFKPSFMDLAGADTTDYGLALYNRKVLITPRAHQLLPRWLRFIKGVVDSEDIPLNLSREMLQDSNLIKRLRIILTKRILKFFVEESLKDRKKFDNFYEDYMLFFKEALTRSQDKTEREDIAQLLRFESSGLEAGNFTSLQEYVSRMHPGQRYIYYMAAPNREFAMKSPYYEAFSKRGYEALFLYEVYDEVVMLQLSEFAHKPLRAVEQELEAEKSSDDNILVGDASSLKMEEATELKQWFMKTFSDRIKNVKIDTKLDKQPVAITTADMGAVRHYLKSPMLQKAKLNDLFKALNLNLEINPRHPIIKSLYSVHKTNPELANLLGTQIIENALVIAGLVEDPRLTTMTLNELLTKLLEHLK